VFCSYYQALKTLEQLEHTYLPQAERYRFVHTLTTSVKGIREQIKNASLSEFKDFLENVRKVSAKIGQIALQQVCEFIAIFRHSLFEGCRISRHG
jgi:hypothetical protein